MTISKDGPKVVDLRTRRYVNNKHDPIVRAADNLLQVLLPSLGSLNEVTIQLVALELAANAVLSAVRQEYGLEELNNVVVDAQHRGKFYQPVWPEEEKGQDP